MKYINPINWFRWIGQFVTAYLYSIPWKEAPKSIPAIILVLALITIAAVAFTEDSSWRRSLMARQLASANEQDDFETMELVLRRQLRTKPNDSDLNFRLALTLEKQEEVEEANAIMHQLVDSKSYGAAARWIIAKNYIGKNWGELDEDQRTEFGDLLQLIYEESPEDWNYKQLYADFLIAQDRMKEAAGLLEELAVRQPMRGLQAAAIYRRMGDEDRADALGLQTLDHVGKLLDDDPTNTVLALAVAQTQLFADRHMDAIQTIKRAVDRAKTPDEQTRARQAMGEAIVAWIMHLEKTTNDSPESQIDLMRKLQVAVNFAPDNPRVLTLVTDKVLSTAQSDHPQVKALQKTLVEGSSPGISHFIMGTGALMRGNNDTALKHLRMAADLLPQSAAILNNLAVAMTARGDENLEDALKLIDRAIDQTSPNTTPHFYETRGQILFRLGRHEKAIPDLLRSLPVESLKLNAHRALATCYEEIGMDEIAEGHRETVKTMEEEEAAKDDKVGETKDPLGL